VRRDESFELADVDVEQSPADHLSHGRMVAHEEEPDR
jgi:hypothetical protein